MTVRPPAVAGLFYPADRVVLRDTEQRLLANSACDKPSADERSPKGMIVPHAGYDYSGPIAATAYARLEPLRDVVTRVVLLGPAHRVPFEGLAASSMTEFATPLGNVPLDAVGIQSAAGLAQVRYLDEAHAAEHSLEVHLPFLQVALNSFQIVPLVVGSATARDVAEVIELLWGGPETLIVVSSDLSHYHDHATASRIDRSTAALVESLCVDDLSGDRACGFLAIAGLLQGARRHGLHVRAVDIRDSSETAGDPSRVVGYGAFVAC